MRTNRITILLAVAGLLALSFILIKDRLFLRQIAIGQTTFSVEIADTEEERRRGLSGRSGLGERRGMLFVFEEETKPSFWMKDMRFPIDIFWITRRQKIIKISEEISPETYPRRFGPDEPILYVLETAAGTAKKYGIAPGHTVEFK